MTSIPKSDVTRTPCADPEAHAADRARAQAALVYAMLERNRFDLTHEKATQADIWSLLTSMYQPGVAKREHRLGPGDIPDFFLRHGVLIEAKGPRHQARAVLRQLERYAAYSEVRFIILATARAMTMPAQIGGKPCKVLNLGRAWL